MKIINKSRLGALRRNKLYGNPGTPEGRSKGGKTTALLFKNNPGLAKPLGFVVRKIISYPNKSSELAEFIGIVLGDGGMPGNHQVRVSFNYQTDFKYAEYIRDLVKNLFSIDCFIGKRKNSNGADVVVSSSNLIDYLIAQGMTTGHKVKNQVDAPAWVKENLEYRIACVRGLIDTDGGVYLHQYKVGGKNYKYLKLCFTNCSRPILKFVLNTLHLLKIKAYETGWHISIQSKSGVKQYFKEIGSHNPKHIERFKLHFGEVPELV